MQTLVQSLIYRLAGLLWVTYTGVIGHHYKLKVHLSTLSSINERIGSILAENFKQKYKIKCTKNMLLITHPSLLQRERERERAVAPFGEKET